MKILIADDDKNYCETMADIIRSFGYETHTLNDPYETINYVEKYHARFSLALLDIEFGPKFDINGIDVLERLRNAKPSLPVVMITGKGTIETAVRATKLGAVNFVEKSAVSKDKIAEVIKAAVDRSSAKGDADEIRKFMEQLGIIGKSKAMIEVGDSAIRYGRTDLNVMITGETGTGKKLIAKAVHAASRRANYPLVTVDIPNIPRDLFQSELFGHVKGAFSGASETKKGLFKKADRGAIFLDEIGDLSPELQSSLFIPIEEKTVRKVGSTQAEEIDVRFISATDKNLLKSMKDGEFREQLYHRLRECQINLPNLRERVEDIPDIARHYLKMHNTDFDDNKTISPAAIAYLQEQKWPGNVRELVSAVRVTLQTTGGEVVEISDFHRTLKNASGQSTPSDAPEPTGRSLKDDLAIIDKRKIESMLERCTGNVTKSASLLGVSRETLHNKIRKYGIDAKTYRVSKTKK